MVQSSNGHFINQTAGQNVIISTVMSYLHDVKLKALFYGSGVTERGRKVEKRRERSFQTLTGTVCNHTAKRGKPITMSCCVQAP